MFPKHVIVINIIFGAFIITPCTSSMTGLLEEIRESTSVSHCLAKSVESRLRYRKVVLFQGEDEDEHMQQTMEYIGKLLMESGQHYVNRRKCHRSDVCSFRAVATTQYLILANSSQDLNLVVYQCLCSQWSHRSKFIILASPTANFDDMIHFIQERMSVKNTVIVTTSGDDVKLYVGKVRCPEESTVKREGVVPLIYSCDSDVNALQIKDRRAGVELETNTTEPRCQLRIGVRHAPPYTLLYEELDKSLKLLGIETQLITVLLDMNEFDIQNSPRVVHDLGHFDFTTRVGFGLVKHLYDRKVDVLMGALSFYENDFHMDMSYPIFISDQYAIVLKRKNMNLFFIFGILKWNVWLTVLCIELFLVFMCYIVKGQEKTRPRLALSSLVFQFYAIMIGKEIPMNRKSLKLIFISWILVTFFLRSSIEAMLIKMSANRDKYNQIDSLDEICNQRYKILVRDINYANFKHGFVLPNCSLPPENIKLVKDPLRELASSDSHNVAAFMYKNVYDFEKWRHAIKGNENDLPFHVIKERINNVPLVFFYNRGDIIGRKFRKRTMRVYQGGLLRHIEQKINFLVSLYVSQRLTSEKKIAMTMEDVDTLFYLYLSGCLLALAAFLGEVAHYYLFFARVQ